MRNLFNKGIYFAGLRYLKMYGIISAAIVSIISLLMTQSTFKSTMGYNISITSLLECNPIIVTVFWLIAPLMLIRMFSFAMKQNSADFWFALPVKRETVAVSLYLSVLTWTLLSLFMCVIIPVLLVPTFAILNFAQVLVTVIDIILCILTVMSAVLIAISISGTSFTAIILALLIIFLPRIFIAATVEMIKSYAPVAGSFSGIPFISSNSNIVINYTLPNMFFYIGNNDNTALTYICSGLLFAVYSVIGIYLFKKRPAEISGNGSVTGKLGAITRIAIATALLLVPTAEICSLIFDKKTNKGVDVMAVIMLLLAFVIYFAYEWITSKSFARAVKVIPGFFVAVGINIAIVGIVILSVFCINSYCPNAEDITSVKIDYNAGNYNQEYFTSKIKEISLEDNEIKTQVSQILKENLITGKTGNYQISATLKSGLFPRERTLWLSEKEYNTLNDTLRNNKKITALYDFVPKDENIRSVYINYDSGIDGKDAMKVFEALKKDIKEGNVTAEQLNRSELLLDKEGNSLDIEIVDGVKNYTLIWNIEEYCTNTMEKIKEISKKNYKKSVEKMEKLLKNPDSVYNIEVYFEPDSDGKLYTFNTNGKVTQFEEFFSKVTNTDAYENECKMCISVSGEDDGEEVYEDIILHVTESSVDDFKERFWRFEDGGV